MRNQTRQLQRALTSLPSDNLKRKSRPQALKKAPKRMNSTLSHSLMIDTFEKQGSSLLGASTRDTLTVTSSALKQKQALLLQSEIASLDLSKIPEKKKEPKPRRESIKPLFVKDNISHQEIKKEPSHEEKMIQKFNQTCKESGHLISRLFQKKYTLRVEREQKLEKLSAMRDEIESNALFYKRMKLELERAENQYEQHQKEKEYLREQRQRIEEQKKLVALQTIKQRNYAHEKIAKKSAEVNKERGLLEIDLNYLKGKYMELQINGRDKAQLYKKKAAEKEFLKKKYEERLQRSKSLQQQMSVSQQKLEDFIEPLK